LIRFLGQFAPGGMDKEESG